MNSGCLERLLAPRNLAVLGASRDPNKWGHRVIGYCQRAGFSGPIYAVNPRAGVTEIGGVPVVHQVEDIPGAVDCVLVAVPAAAVEDAVQHCAAAGAGAGVIAASGFAEIGHEGQRVQARIAEIAAGASMRLLGPNCFGLYRADAGLVLTPHDYFPPGRIALLTQSGNVAIAVSRMAQRCGLGFSTVVGIGNQIDVGFGELLVWLAQDDQTAAIGLYAEGLNPASGDRFVRGLDRCAAAGKAVVVLKSGRSAAGTQVAATHTAALASDDRIWTSVLAAHGAVRVGSTEALVDALACGVSVPRLRGRRVAVVTDGGGDSTMAADALENAGMELASLGPTTLRTLEGLIPPAAPRPAGLNPMTIDTPGGMDDDPRLVARCVEVLSGDPGVDVTVVGGVFGGYRFRREEENESASRLAELASGPTPLVVQSAFADSDTEAIVRLRQSGIAMFPTITRLVSALATRAPRPEGDAIQDPPATSPTVSGADSKIMLPTEAGGVLADAGLAVPPMRLVRSEADLEAVTDSVPAPFCVKLADPAVSHKSELGAVYLNLPGLEAVRPAARSLWGRFPGSPLLVMPMFRQGVELLVGAFTDQLFGPMVLLGRGGIWAEAERDNLILPAPSSCKDVEPRLRELRMWPMLVGRRGQPAVDVRALCELAIRMGSVAAADPFLTVEVNPVICYSQGYALADIRMARL